jgi:hypothetical protein
MSKIIALPILAISIVLAACGASATEPPSGSSYSITTTSVAGVQSLSAIVPPSIIDSGPDMTPIPGSTAFPASTSLSGNTPAAPAKVVVIVEQPGVGTDVGDTLPRFEFTLFDGTKRSTAQLSSQGRPIFLFFFATW